jgi:hypothetical protein
MVYYLVEKWSSDITLPDACKVVSLTPMACIELEACGIDYLTFADFFTTGEVRGDVDAYLMSQLPWFEQFDEFLSGHFPESKAMGVKLATLFSFNIKHLVDAVILTSRMLNTFIDRTAPSEIVFVPEVRGEDVVERRRWFYYGESVFYRLAEKICLARGVIYTCIADRVCASDIGRTRKSWQDRFVAAALKRMRTSVAELVRWYYENVKATIRPWSFFSPVAGSRKKILVLKNVDFLYGLIADCRHRGMEVGIYRDEDLQKTKGVELTTIKESGYHESSEAHLKADTDSTLQSLMDSSIVGWINEQCGVDVSDVLRSRFRYLVCDLFPRTLIRTRYFTEYYDKNQVDYVINYSTSTDDDYAALAAAKVSKKTKSIGIAHGVDALSAPNRYFTQFSLYDYYFVPTDEEADHINGMAMKYSARQVHVGVQPYFKAGVLRKVKQGKLRRCFTHKAKPVILFAPIVYAQRVNISMHRGRPIQWDYYKLHNAIIDYFVRRQDYHFIWKALLQYFNPHEDFYYRKIVSRGAQNITYSTGTFDRWLSCVDKVITDHPSTAFYKAALSNIPVVALYKQNEEEIRAGALRSLGSCLQSYSSTQEALDIISRFIDDDPMDYKPGMHSNENSVLNMMSE